jgi:hypothetical protein
MRAQRSFPALYIDLVQNVFAGHEQQAAATI